MLCYEPDQANHRAIALWNSAPLERFADSSDSTQQAYERAIQRWENEGGETPATLQDAGKKISGKSHESIE